MKQTISTAAFIFFLFFQSVFIKGQGVAIGQWRDHFPYDNVINVCEAGNTIYGATPYSLVAYDKTDNSVRRINKINGLSDLNITSIAYCSRFQTLVVAYKNANLDLISNNTITNIPDIKRKQILGNKTINRIKIIDNTAYLLCGFGIVVLNVDKAEIADTYYLGAEGTTINIYDIEKFNNKFYVATNKGIYQAQASNPNLSNYENWSRELTNPHPSDTFNIITAFNNKLYFNAHHKILDTDTIYIYDGSSWTYFNPAYSSSRLNMHSLYGKIIMANSSDVDVFDTTGNRLNHVYTYLPEPANPIDAILDKDGTIWIGDKYAGMIKNPGDWDYHKLKFEGPVTSSVFSLYSNNNKVWVAPGGFDESWAPLYMQADVYAFGNEKWATYTTNNPALDTIRDIVNICSDKNDNGHCFAASWNYGVLEFNNGALSKIYNGSNSSLQPYGVTSLFRIDGIAVDDNNNLWVANSNAFKALSVKTPLGSWQSYYLGTVPELGKILIDDYNQKWIINRSNGIIVFNDNHTLSNTADDNFKVLSNSEGLGALPSKNVWCMAKDRDGQIWVGTDAGVAVFSSPGNVFSNHNFDAFRILVELDGFFQYLLEFETVTDIAVDGSNKKWISTQSAGVFLISADGTKQLLHFTTENSPLISNNVNSIAINQESGEVFFGTPNGIVSYKGEATGGNDQNQDVYAYPNPVREGYEGLIAIKGLVTDADIKITDISGTLVYQTKAEGGQAIWNGKNFKGEKARTGVYVVFATNEDGSQKAISKILFVN